MASKFQLVQNPIRPVGCHAWNKDRTKIAISPNNNVVEIYSYRDGQFTIETSLKEHGQRVTGIDWAPATNQLVTCAEDRNAYVWNIDAKTGEWKPTLVILRINRAATCVKWSPNEDKFAVGSGSRLISICYFDEENDWWVSKHIKKPIRSTVLSLDWHPNNVLIAAGSSDFTCRVFSGYVKTVDPKPPATCWGKKMPFGNMMAEFGTGNGGGGWVHDVSFTEDGEKLVFVAHDSSVTVVDGTNGQAVSRTPVPMLPFRCVTWITPNSFVACGHDNIPMLFEHAGPEVKHVGPLDIPPEKKEVKVSAMDKFRNLDKKGSADAKATGTAVKSTHQNSISEVSIYGGSKDAAAVLSTIGVDGKIVLWDIGAIKSKTGYAIA
mmetsp:Transcript_25412/g.35637  ORF Transcript_25412/g.35637 Transcript_25412/m.35637 type:complete len:378 (+) Transcript_25412:54-1187(+)